MILFTGQGEIASNYLKKYQGKAISFRHLSVQEMKEIIPHSKVIIHNSANIYPKTIQQATNDNFILTKDIVDAVIEINPKIRFIYLSSMSILKNKNEYLDTKAMTHYSFSKYLGEIYCLNSPLEDIRIVRFSTIFYGNPLKDGLSKLIYEAVKNKIITIYNNGEAKRDFLPISILTDYLHKLTVTEDTHNIYTFCSGKSTSFFEIVQFLSSKISELVIEENKADTPKILHEFSKEDIIRIGNIDFNIMDFIDRYIQSLVNNENSSI